MAQGDSSIIKTIEAIHDTWNGVEDLDEKVVGSLEEAASNMIEATGHAFKNSTTVIGNMFHVILGGIEGTTQWCLILAIILVLLYINHSTILKFCGRKPSGLPKSPTYPLPRPSVDSDPTRNSLVNPTTTSEQPSILPLVLSSATLHEVSVSQKTSK